MFVGGQYSGSIGPGGYDGSHWNSLILSHAYYLAIEGGTNASTGLTVAGAGSANRLEVFERSRCRSSSGRWPTSCRP